VSHPVVYTHDAVYRQTGRLFRSIQTSSDKVTFLFIDPMSQIRDYYGYDCPRLANDMNYRNGTESLLKVTDSHAVT